ncbi:MAG TPA: hypothetical protein VMT00_16945 [Thermoanaerobaculia bacterium]|nr:hypothetical protein [Thermoanaerobaculia bacterium]
METINENEERNGWARREHEPGDDEATRQFIEEGTNEVSYQIPRD